MMRSQLMLGKVWHRRPGAHANAFQYKVLYLALDLAEIDTLDEKLRLLGHNARTLYSVNDRDHMGDERGGFTAEIEQLVQQQLPGGQDRSVTLITQPSMLGYVFNPVSFYLMRDSAGATEVVVAEVHNRRRERHVYVMRPERDLAGTLSATFEKDFYVSPFLPMDARYRFFSYDREDGVTLCFDLVRGDELLLATSLELSSEPLSDRNLAKAMLTHPLVPQKTLAMIYWQAIRLRLKGAAYRKPSTAERKEDFHAEAQRKLLVR